MHVGKGLQGLQSVWRLSKEYLRESNKNELKSSCNVSMQAAYWCTVVALDGNLLAEYGFEFLLRLRMGWHPLV